MIFIKILVLLIPYANTIHGIQVYENITDDITTSTTKLAIVPTPIVKSYATSNDSVTESNVDSKEQNSQMITSKPSGVVTLEKTSRKKESGINETGRNISKIEQQEKTSSNVKHEKFVPSPEISLSGIEIQQPAVPQTNENSFYPMSQYYRPVKHSLHFHSSAPITSNSNWRHTPDLESLPKNYPKFEDEVQQHKEKEKFTWPPSSNDNNKWFYAPEKPTEKPSKPSGGGKWKWVSDEEEEQEKRSPYLPIIPSTLPSNDFSYAFEIPSTDSTPYSFGSTKFDGIEQQSNFEAPSTPTTLGMLESEWESPFTSSNGKLKHKTKGKGHNISPWKKILHVLTAAIPIGLLISALTPQVIYVDPNSTLSLSPSNSLSLLSTTKHRSLDDRGAVQLSEPNDSPEHESGRKFMSNPLMDFLHVLRDNGNSVERTDSCDDRKFCEASRSGADPNANVLNKMLWKIANETPEFQARKSGLEHIFQAIRNNNCSIFECKKPDLNNHRQQNYRN